MTVLALPYRTMGTTLNELGYREKTFTRSAELDRLFQRMADEMYTDTGDTLENRVVGIAKYLGTKRLIMSAFFEHLSKEESEALVQYSLDTALNQEGSEGFASSGRFSRTLTAVIASRENYIGPISVWLNNAVMGMNVTLGTDLPPVILPINYYRIDTGPLQTGTSISVSVGDRLRIYSSAINYSVQEWEKDGTPIDPQEVNDVLNIPDVVAGDAGVYSNAYQNPYGRVNSDDVTVTVA